VLDVQLNLSITSATNETSLSRIGRKGAFKHANSSDFGKLGSE
jgi:hypothetical protein